MEEDGGGETVRDRGGDDSSDTAGLRHRSSQSCDSTHKTAQVQVRLLGKAVVSSGVSLGYQPDARAGHVQELANMK